MLNGPTLMLQEMNEMGENVGALNLDLFKVSACYPRRIHLGDGKYKYEGSYIVCNTITYCTVFSMSDLVDEMWRTKKEWDNLQNRRLSTEYSQDYKRA